MKTRFLSFFLAALLGLAVTRVAAAGPTPAKPSADEIAIREADAAWAKATTAKAFEPMLSFYDSDAIAAGSAMFPARGLKAFRENWAKMLARPDFALTWETGQVVVAESGKIACSTGKWTVPGSPDSGPYLAVWRKQSDGQWKVLVDAAWKTIPALVATADSEKEVLDTMHGMLAAEERLDAAAVWAYHADVPDYRWADIDGQLYDFAGTRKNWAEYYASCAKLKFTTKREEVTMLTPDLAFYLWQGASEVTAKDGTVSRSDLWTACYLLRRIGGTWKMVGGQESAAPAQPVPPPTATTSQQARAALEAYILQFWSQHDTAALGRAFAPTMVYHYNGEIIGGTPTDHLGYLKDFGGAFPDLVGTIDQFAFSDGIGAASTNWTGTHKGELAGIAVTGNKPIPPTGRKVTIATNYVFRVEGGKIVELWETWDEGAFYHRLTQPEPTPAAAAK